jgi:tetratricopeptide (TPR) repeat protein
MSSSRPTTIIAALSLLISLTGSIFVLREVDRVRPPAVDDDTLYVTSPNMVKRASLGFRGLMACIYWTRVVQYFGHRHYYHAMTYNQLGPLLEITTALDPQLTIAYEFGASFLAPAPPNGAGQLDRAIKLIEYGIGKNPNNWRLYYDLGFIYYTELHDYKTAEETFRRGAKVPHANPAMKVLAAQMAQHAGEFATARMLWSATYEANEEPNIRRNAAEHLRALRVDEDVTNLQAAVTRFGERTGRLPVSMAELAAAEHLPGVPLDPDSHPYQMSRQGRILVENPDNFPFITQGTPPGYQPAQPNPTP